MRKTKKVKVKKSKPKKKTKESVKEPVEQDCDHRVPIYENMQLINNGVEDHAAALEATNLLLKRINRFFTLGYCLTFFTSENKETHELSCEMSYVNRAGIRLVERFGLLSGNPNFILEVTMRLMDYLYV